jgi:nitrate/nitrite-specific signal transduction histidine kinase
MKLKPGFIPLVFAAVLLGSLWSIAADAALITFEELGLGHGAVVTNQFSGSLRMLNYDLSAMLASLNSSKKTSEANLTRELSAELNYELRAMSYEL